jgi:hypothetical protein
MASRKASLAKKASRKRLNDTTVVWLRKDVIRKAKVVGAFTGRTIGEVIESHITDALTKEYQAALEGAK